MSKCDFCGKEMLDNVGCDCRYIIYNEKKYERIKAGDLRETIVVNSEGHCHDCNAPYGSYHHPGCDAERCPVCGRQLLSCDCEDIQFEKMHIH